MENISQINKIRSCNFSRDDSVFPEKGQKMRTIFHSVILFFCVLAGKTFGIGIIHRLLLVSGMNDDLLRKFGANIGKAARINWPLVIAFAKKDYSNLTIGNKCHIGKDCFLDITDHINIGNNVTISMRATILTHMDVCDSCLSNTYPRRVGAVNIGDDVYIGAGAMILCGINIGKGALVGAYTLVNKDVPPGATVAGVPQNTLKTKE